MQATAREVRDLISASASRYADSSYEDSGYDVLSADQIASLRHVDPRGIFATLDPVGRSGLVLQEFNMPRYPILQTGHFL